jgi:hypothetical protein
MFRDAYGIASKFTYPIIVSWRTVSGTCSAGLGAYVIVNEDGWIATAGHVLKQLMDLMQNTERVKNHTSNEAAIRNDKALDDKERRRRLKELGHIKPEDISHSSVLFGGSPTATSISNVTIVEGFVPNANQIYPVFKDPSKGLESGGVSLCKLGYPFHSIQPTFNDKEQRFELPKEALPVPLFPIEGILTRIANVVVTNAADPGIPLKWVETSSPGLRGQSGGPTFDKNAVIWAIQCQTSHFDLGFNSSVKQFFNVGLGVHPETMFNVFDRNAVKYKVSDY